MKFDKAKLTAYALGELKGKEAEEAAALVRNDPEAARFVDEMRGFGQTVAKDLARESMPKADGPLPVLKKIMEEQKKRPSERQLWLRAGAVALAVLVLFFAAPLKKLLFTPTHEGANQANLGGETATKTDAGEEQGPRTHRAKNEEAKFLEQDFEALAKRELEKVAVAECRLQLPALSNLDRDEQSLKYISRTYLMGQSGTELGVTADTSPQPLRKDVGVEELEKVGGYSYFRARQGDLTLIISKVPDTVSKPFCWIRVVLEGKLSPEAALLAQPLLEEFARRVAETMQIK